ncbi:TonB-dependent receptor [Cnuella takakiae]|uniref:TonB-dependent receptor n=1 Tax=Cnuella takakiae TaxID=1302690 RepID=UPI001FE3732F|nr:TonB-dependent receptor [Cnuella takakiae]
MNTAYQNRIRALVCSLLLCAVQAFGQDTTKVAPADSLSKTLEDVVVTAMRTPQQLMQSPVGIEKVTAKDFARSAAPSFYDALQSLKGVQMITPSLGFRVINTRGFANTTNVRFAQLVDGADVQSPHIGAPVGNALGPSDLDIRSVELVPGGASALYGMNTTNGMVNLFTKKPFEQPGLSVQQKAGINHVHSAVAPAKLFAETALRWAHVWSSKLAFKLNGSYTTGYDWVADDRTDLSPLANASTGLLGAGNPALDPVNGYGNESSNRRTLALQGKNYVVARSGYYEKEVADYRLQNVKADASIYYKPTGNATLSYTYRRADFNTIYQRSNRFRLQGYVLQQHALDYAGSFIRAKAYVNLENTGRSYNLRSMAENLDRVSKTDDQWFAAYASGFNNAVGQGLSPAAAHGAARGFADAGRLQPGTEAFANSLHRLQDINNWDSGAALRVKAALAHAEVQVDLTQQWLQHWKKRTGVELLTGMDMRSYVIVPDGNYFINPDVTKAGRNLVYGRWGAFLSASRNMLAQKLRTGLVMRLDKNDYFTPRLAVRATAVYSPNTKHSLRLAVQNGYRYPSIFEGFSNINSGGVRRVGGLRVMSQGVFEASWLRSSIDAFATAVNRDVNTGGLSRSAAIEKNKSLLRQNSYTYLEPEAVSSIEGGYRGRLLKGRLFVDVDLYYNRYRNFIAQVEAHVPLTTVADSIPYALYDRRQQARYRLWTNSKTVVHNYGAALKARMDLGKGFIADGNLSYARLQQQENSDGLEDGFNTPKWMVNLGLSNDQLWGRWGGGILFRWQDSYYWQSFLVNGQVPAIAALDAQVTYAFAKQPFRIKVGATNLTNHYQASFLGGPQVGGFYYTALSYGVR